MWSENNLFRNDGDPGSNQQTDEFIRHSLRVDADDRRVERLRQYWRRLSHQQAWRRRKLLSASLVAASLAACALFFVGRETRDDSLPEPVSDKIASVVDGAPSANSVPSVDVQGEHASLTYGRPPTEYERILFAARQPRQLSAKRPNETTIEDLASRLTNIPRGNTDKVLASAGYSQSSAIDGLLEASRESAQRDNAFDALEKLVDVEGLAELARASRYPEVRAALALRLLATNSDASLLEYLSMVDDMAFREQALGVAKQAAKPPIGQLLVLLDDQEKSVRLAAAMTLGRLNGPDVTRLLIDRVTDQPSNSTEAWLALLACRGELADEFLAYAGRRPQLLGYYNNARVLWAQSIP